ncbi:methyltransferase type 11 [Cellulomonas sp. Root485]|uniref:class I SAM-dependent methyltransferase n=1 Tax=Cellulomonas sp. Root485 TaxID=1736546 RepID=UPI0007020939|nr:methyltransferase domain-containing protein [Cellulomonas sp. Root485]KQY24599.1 methyltransferase type 11 [Cellulomonas sp. Root485]
MESERSERDAPPTAGLDYAERLYAISNVWWKRALHVQAPYQANIRRFDLGRAIDVGCGIGRNLATLAPGSVGVDHNPYAIEVARRTGVPAYTDDEFFADKELSRPESFDGMLVAHVAEHLTPTDARTILGMYVPLVRPGGRVAFITPQERGYASDHTHITFVGFDELRDLARDLGLEPVRTGSFPFPRWAGKAFVYNEFVMLARKPG